MVVLWMTPWCNWHDPSFILRLRFFWWLSEISPVRIGWWKITSPQWRFLVPLIGGRRYISHQLASYTTYIPLIYCLLGDYISPIPPIKGTRNSCWSPWRMAIFGYVHSHPWEFFDVESPHEFLSLPLRQGYSYLPHGWWSLTRRQFRYRGDKDTIHWRVPILKFRTWILTWEIQKNTWSLLSFGPWFFGDEHPSSPRFPWVWIFNFHPNLETFWQVFSWKW